MKKVFALFVIFTVIVSCKNDKKNDAEATSDDTKEIVAEDGKTIKQSDGLIAIRGNFLYVEENNAAVLQTATQVYGVVIDDKMNELIKQVEPFKTESYDMVPVTVRGRIIKNEDAKDEWENKIEIKEILKVSKPDPNDNEVIKLGNKQS